MNALRALNCPVDQWNMLLVYILVHKLGKSTKKSWEIGLGSEKNYPTIEKLYKFLCTQICSLKIVSPRGG